MLFLCPVCRDEYIGVAFKNPLDGGPAAPNCKYYWQRTGDSFETITLNPSVNAATIGHWHGWIRDGKTIGTETGGCKPPSIPAVAAKRKR